MEPSREIGSRRRVLVARRPEPVGARACVFVPYVEADEAQVVSLWSEAGLVRPWNDPRKDIARKLRVQRDLFLVALQEGAIVGTVMGGYDGHRGWVNYLAVALSWRRKGPGRR